jgi:hypothetical protein
MKILSIFLGASIIASSLLRSEEFSQISQPKIETIQANEIVNTTSIITTIATIVKIDTKTRAITLKKESGEIITKIAGEEVKNFAQIEIGDIMTSIFTTTMNIKIIKDTTDRETGKTVQETTKASKIGKKPSVVLTRVVTNRAIITKIDTNTQIITLQGQEGLFVIKIEDPKNLNKLHIGDQIDAISTESTTINVSPAPKR